MGADDQRRVTGWVKPKTKTPQTQQNNPPPPPPPPPGKKNRDPNPAKPNPANNPISTSTSSPKVFDIPGYPK